MNSMYQPLFSVLVANYNNGTYIKQTIESIFAQTYTNWEIIIVDDASTDNSMQIINEFKDYQNIKVYQNDLNRKCGYTKRKLIELSSGELFAFLDSDDTIEPNALELMVHAHSTNQHVGLIYSQSYDCNENLIIQGVTAYQKQIPENTTYLEYGRYSVFPFISIKRELYNKTEGIHPKFHIAEDQDLYYKMEEVAPLLFLQIPLYYRRINTGNNISIGANEHMSLMFHMVAKADAYVRRNKDFDKAIIKDLEHWLEYYEREIVKKAIKNFKESSQEYTWGNILLHPISFITYLIKKITK